MTVPDIVVEDTASWFSEILDDSGKSSYYGGSKSVERKNKNRASTKDLVVATGGSPIWQGSLKSYPDLFKSGAEMWV